MEVFRVLIGEFLECWHLLCTAEDRTCGEAFLRVRRELARALQQEKTALRTGVPPTSVMGCGLHVDGTPCRPISGQGRGHPCSSKSRFSTRAASSTGWKSCRIITFPIQSRIAEQKRTIREKLARFSKQHGAPSQRSVSNGRSFCCENERCWNAYAQAVPVLKRQSLG